MKLRDYQQEACDAFFTEAQAYPSQSQVLALPTGTGKSVIIAEICRRAANAGLRVMVLHRSKELVSQNYERYTQVDPAGAARVGCYSAGIGIRETDNEVIFASVQSVCKRGAEFGVRHLVIVDEAHQIPMEDESQYQNLIKALRASSKGLKLLGLTATPYRTKGGVIHGGSDSMFDRMSYVAPLSDMFDKGYLTRPVTVDVDQVDLSDVKIVRGDFEKAAMQNAFVGRSISGEIKATADQYNLKTVLIFTSGVAHAEMVTQELKQLGEKAEVVTGMTIPLLRSAHLSNFSNGSVRFLVNVDVLTTGFDEPKIDGIIVARGTQSPGLFMQMIGRGTRLHDSKSVCMVADYGGNVVRHGPVDSDTYGMDTIADPTSGNGEAPKRCCPKCFEVQAAQNRKCEKCGLEFPVRPKDLISSNEAITIVPTYHMVVHTDYKLWKGREDDQGNKKKDTLRVQYKLEVDEKADLQSRKRWASEWLCVEHKGYPQKKFAAWWADRSEYAVPETITEALRLIDAGCVAHTKSLTCKKDGKWDRIVSSKAHAIEKLRDFDLEYYEKDSPDADCPF